MFWKVLRELFKILSMKILQTPHASDALFFLIEEKKAVQAVRRLYELCQDVVKELLSLKSRRRLFLRLSHQVRQQLKSFF